MLSKRRRENKIKINETKRNLFDGLGDLGADTVAGEESGSDGSGRERPNSGIEKRVAVKIGGGEDLVGAAS